MKRAVRNTISVLLAIAALPAVADLQNVQVGGSVRIRGDYFDYDNVAGKPVNSNTFVEQRTRLHVKADFTDNVGAFIELDSYGNWGEDFRSNYLTGVDSRGTDTISVYQAYIDANQLWGTNLSARIGRQEIKLGSGWLAGANDAAPYFRGLSFDALKLAYTTDRFWVAGVAAKLAETSPTHEDGDTDLYGVYASYTGIERVALDAYWLFIRDATNFKGSLDAHAFGLRGSGKVGAFDFEAETAYELIKWDAANALRVGGGTSSGALGANLLLGYTFDASWAPRVYVGGAYFGSAKDNLPFNRLFSDWKYSLILDTDANLSNIWLVHGGVSVNPAESLKLTASAGYIQAIRDRDIPIPHSRNTRDSDKPLGIEAGVRADYAYTKDLSFAIGYSHLFALDGLEDGNYVPNNGATLAIVNDVNYVYAETKLSF